MKYILYLLLLLNFNLFSQVNDEIYYQVVNDFVLKDRKLNVNFEIPTIVIVDSTRYWNIPLYDDFEKLKSKYHKLEYETFKDLVDNNKSTLNLDSFKELNFDVNFINHDNIPDSSTLLKEFPNWNLMILEFSNVGFNKEKNQAIVYYGFSSINEGGGAYFILKKKCKKWKIKKVLPLWST